VCCCCCCGPLRSGAFTVLWLTVFILLLPGHHNPIQALNPSPSPNHRLTLTPTQSRRLQARTPMVHTHAQENGMRSVGGHGDAASHANHLVIETAVVDASNNCARWQCYYHLTCPTASCTVSYMRYSIPSHSVQHPWNCLSKQRAKRSPCKSIQMWR
jgi:hypothetical protein